MISIESSNINTGGSFNLLKDLVEHLNSNGIESVVYVSYSHIYQELSRFDSDKVTIVHTNFIETLLRYCKRNRTGVLYFCSLPPFAKNRCSYVYFHSEYFTESLFRGYAHLNCVERVKKVLYYFLIMLFRNNVDAFMCQTKRISDKLQKTYHIESMVLPFFKAPVSGLMYSDKEIDFIYPATYDSHKNHISLLKAVMRLRQNRTFNLILTIEDEDEVLSKIIKSINTRFPNTVINIGLVPHEDLIGFIARSKFLIFPSLMESLGLPLIEAVQYNAKVLCSNLDYAYAAITNPIVFEPDDINSISIVMNNALDGVYDEIEQKSKIEDSKQQIIKLLGNE